MFAASSSPDAGPGTLGERNLAGQEVLPYSGNTISDQQDHSFDLTQWIAIEAAPDGGILAGRVGDDRVFVWRSGNRLKAYKADCPHWGALLNKGIVAGSTIRLKWDDTCA